MFSLGICKCQWCTNKILLELDAGGSHALDLFFEKTKKAISYPLFPFSIQNKSCSWVVRQGQTSLFKKNFIVPWWNTVKSIVLTLIFTWWFAQCVLEFFFEWFFPHCFKCSCTLSLCQKQDPHKTKATYDRIALFVWHKRMTLVPFLCLITEQQHT